LKKEYNSHRIVFALRGLTNTYNFRDAEALSALRNICIRHDVSGDYPQSSMDFRGEKEMVTEARKPRDDCFSSGKLSLEDVAVEGIQNDYEEIEID
jgi:hypothetical protein